MENKTLIIGGVALLGIGVGAYFLLNKKKDDTGTNNSGTKEEPVKEEPVKEESVKEESKEIVKPVPKPMPTKDNLEPVKSPAPPVKINKGDLSMGTLTTLNMTKPTLGSNVGSLSSTVQSKKCGKKPLLKGAKRTAWEKCIASGGVSSFDGLDDIFSNFEDFDLSF